MLLARKRFQNCSAGHLVGFTYNPDYLRDDPKYRDTITDGNEVARAAGISFSNVLSGIAISRISDLIDVWAYDVQDLHNKVFKISRISEVETLDEDWEFEGSHRRYSTDVFRMSGKSAKHIKLRLGLRAKNLLLEEYPLASKDLTRNGRHWILETDVYDYAGVCRFYLGLADDIEILGSPELEDYIQEYTRRYVFR